MSNLAYKQQARSDDGEKNKICLASFGTTIIFVATLRSGFCSFLSNCIAGYPEQSKVCILVYYFYRQFRY
jgi:hypothetical protein